MSRCPACHGSGRDETKTQAARKRGTIDRLSWVRCWHCHGNGNDTAADFFASLRAAEQRGAVTLHQQ